jgi:hypothetical protein
MEKGTQEDIKLLLCNLAKIPLCLSSPVKELSVTYLDLSHTTALRFRYYSLHTIYTRPCGVIMRETDRPG